MAGELVHITYTFGWAARRCGLYHQNVVHIGSAVESSSLSGVHATCTLMQSLNGHTLAARAGTMQQLPQAARAITTGRRIVTVSAGLVTTTRRERQQTS